MDIDKVRAEKDAPNLAPFVWEFGGEKYEISLTDVDVLALGALLRGDVHVAVRRLFTPEQYAQLEASPERFTNATVEEFLTGLTDHMTGLTVGESSASSGSSKNTRKPSRPTSKGSTASRSRGSVKKN